jgi:hypothetical protein
LNHRRARSSISLPLIADGLAAAHTAAITYRDSKAPQFEISAAIRPPSMIDLTVDNL